MYISDQLADKSQEVMKVTKVFMGEDTFTTQMRRHFFDAGQLSQTVAYADIIRLKVDVMRICVCIIRIWEKCMDGNFT